MVPNNGSNPRTGLPTVLAVDDVHLSLLMIKQSLKDLVNLYIAKSAADALKVLTMISVDLLLLDLSMPEMDGYGFLEHMRSMPEYEKTPVIIVSSNVKQSSMGKTLNYGVVDYIGKPFQAAVLREKVLKALSSGS